MDIVGSAASILTLANTVISICIQVRATYKLNRGFDATFDAAILDAEVQVQRLVNWGKAFRAETYSTPLCDLLNRVLQNVEVEVRNIKGYVKKYMDGADNLLTSISSSELLAVSTLPAQPAQNHIQDGTTGTSSGKKKGQSLVKRFNFVLSDKDGYVYRSSEMEVERLLKLTGMQSLLSHSAALEKAVDQLHALVPPTEQLNLQLTFLTTLLKSDDINELGAIASSTGSYLYQDIQSSATIKAARIRGEIRPRPSNDVSKLLECNQQSFEVERRWAGKDIGMYEGRTVLVEWKTISHKLSSKESERRIADVARLLHQTGVTRPKDLITLNCLGWMKSFKGPPSIGLVYALPPAYTDTLPKSLFQILSGKGNDSSSWPSWEQRRNLARVLARAVFQLHVVGWLHKGIRPQNVLFIGDGKALKSPYLIGFDYSRRGESGEKTEATDLAFDLYRHPHAQGEARSRFQASFDLFALGLMLLEIGLWEKLQDQREKLGKEFKSSSSDAQSKFHWLLVEGGGPLKDLPFYMGHSYSHAVKTCLSTNGVDLAEEVYIRDIIRNLEN